MRIDIADMDRLLQAVREFEGNADEVITSVFHNEAGDLAQEEIYRLMPVSGKHWSGKAPPAKSSQSLRNIKGKLSVTVTTNETWQYLYFPNDGTNTRYHVGNQRFFERGGEAATDEIIERCIAKLTNKL